MGKNLLRNLVPLTLTVAGLVGCATLGTANGTPQGYSVKGDEVTSKQEIVDGMNKLAGLFTGTARIVGETKPYTLVYTTWIEGSYDGRSDNFKALKRVYQDADTNKDGVINSDEYYTIFLDTLDGRRDTNCE